MKAPRARARGTPLANSRQERFAAEVASGRTARQAYTLAGYTGDTSNAARVHGRAHVLARIAELQSAAAERAEIDQAFVIRRLVENERRASQAVPVLDADGRPTGVYTFDAQAVNRALELIGKQLGMFTQRIDVKVTQAVEALIADVEPLMSRDAYRELLRACATLMGLADPTITAADTTTEN